MGNIKTGADVNGGLHTIPNRIFLNNPLIPLISVMTCSRTYLLFNLFILWQMDVSAQFRKYSNEFLNIGAGARALGMGGAQVASVSDPTAGYWNPAGLTAINKHPIASLMHAEYFAGIGKYDYASLAVPIGDPAVAHRSLGLVAPLPVGNHHFSF